jgi:glycosyltransferase involved in cell wall biosynthesis
MPNGRREGCPTIALEALAAGVPVVATTGRATEFVDSDDATALSHAIERALVSRQSTYELVSDLDWIDVARRLLRNE